MYGLFTGIAWPIPTKLNQKRRQGSTSALAHTLALSALVTKLAALHLLVLGGMADGDVLLPPLMPAALKGIVGPQQTGLQAFHDKASQLDMLFYKNLKVDFIPYALASYNVSSLQWMIRAFLSNSSAMRSVTPLMLRWSKHLALMVVKGEGLHYIPLSKLKRLGTGRVSGSDSVLASMVN